MKAKEIIIEGLKQDFGGSADYHSGVNDGMYTLWRYLYESHEIPPEIKAKINQRLHEAHVPVVEHY